MNKNQKGIVTVLFILLMAIIATFVLIVGQSRIFLALQRSRSARDSLVTSYHAESVVNDLILQIQRGTINTDDFNTQTLSDGTKIEVVEKSLGETRTITINASRPFAVSAMEIIQKSSTSSTSFRKAEIILSLDCTSSMDNAADSANPGKGNRISALRKGMIELLDEINTISDPNLKSKFHIGVAVFRNNAEWLHATDGTDLVPTNNLQRVRDAINNGISNTFDSSPACRDGSEVFGNTNVGIGFTFAHTYFSSNPTTPDVKRVEIIVTDGEPNTATPYVGCPQSYYCPIYKVFCPPPPPTHRFNGSTRNSYGWNCNDPRYDGIEDSAKCVAESEKFMACAIASNSSTVPESYGEVGSRDANIDAYIITIVPNMENSARGRRVKGILDKYATKHFNTPNANEVSSTLIDILKEVSSGISEFQIKRVIPE